VHVRGVGDLGGELLRGVWRWAWQSVQHGTCRKAGTWASHLLALPTFASEHMSMAECVWVGLEFPLQQVCVWEVSLTSSGEVGALSFQIGLSRIRIHSQCSILMTYTTQDLFSQKFQSN
jgi:hypothetical protein